MDKNVYTEEYSYLKAVIKAIEERDTCAFVAFGRQSDGADKVAPGNVRRGAAPRPDL
jgi:hypothetical protein